MTVSIQLKTACPPLMTASVAPMTASIQLMTASTFETGGPIVRLNPRELGIRARIPFMRSLPCEMHPRVHLAEALTPFTGALARGRDSVVDLTDALVKRRTFPHLAASAD